jgi:hypothetical protein
VQAYSIVTNSTSKKLLFFKIAAILTEKTQKVQIGLLRLLIYMNEPHYLKKRYNCKTDELK